ncbi:hypothetical protein MHYP_G00111310 [Metynnis hypsauchen]
MDTAALRADSLASLKMDISAIIKSELKSEEFSSLKSELKEVKAETVNSTTAIRTEMDAMKHTVSDIEEGLSSWSSEGSNPEKAEQKTTVIIAKLHYYQNCVHVLHRARETGPLHYKGEAIAIFPDYSTKVTKACAAFNNVWNLLRGRRDVLYGIIFPASLCISFNGDEKEFLDPEKAMTYVKGITAT